MYTKKTIKRKTVGWIYKNADPVNDLQFTIYRICKQSTIDVNATYFIQQALKPLPIFSQVREIARKCSTGHVELRWQLPALECMQEVGKSFHNLALSIWLRSCNQKRIFIYCVFCFSRRQKHSWSDSLKMRTIH